MFISIVGVLQKTMQGVQSIGKGYIDATNKELWKYVACDMAISELFAAKQDSVNQCANRLV